MVLGATSRFFTADNGSRPPVPWHVLILVGG
nr:MAG TPA: hypothetical protein [Caudoviricetes sp.]